MDDVLITHWADEAGVRHSRLYSLTGAPLSPILGRVEKWSTEGTPVVCEAFADLGLFVAGRSLDSDPDQPLLGRLLLPIDSGGRPLALPEGAIGVFPVPLRFYDNERTPPAGWGRTQAWSVVYPTSDDGFLFTLTPGSLAFALDQAPTATRHEGFARDTFRGQDPRTGYERDEAYISVQSTQDQLWRGYQYGHWQVASAAANDEVMAARNAGQAVRDIRDAERQARDAAERARSRTRYTDALANGTGCNLPPPIGFADDDIIFAHAAACPQTYSLDQRGWVQWRGAPAETVRGIDHAHVQAQQAAIAEQAELAEQASRYISPGEREAMWRAAGDAWVQGINQGADARQDARRRQYEADWQRSQRAY